MQRFLTRLLVVCLLAAVVPADAADFPRSISYQGRVTDLSDSPITNPAASFEFRLFDAAVGGTQLWNETVVLAVENGLFAHDLGSSCGLCQIPDNLFFDDDTLWLEVVYETEVMTPRTMMAATAYAYRVASIDKSSGGTITGEVRITGNAPGNQLEVNNSGGGRGGYFQISNGANTEAAVQGTHVGTGAGGSFFSEFGPGLRAFSNVGDAAEFDGSIDINGAVRNLEFRNNADLVRAEMGIGADGGELVLYSSSGVDAIVMNGGIFGDASVALPAEAIQSFEMLDEPGLANNSNSIFNISGTSFQTIVTRSINVPANGYVLAMGTGDVNVVHSSGLIDDVTLRITDFTGSVDVEVSFSGATPTGQYQVPFAVQGVFQVTPGVKSFSLRGSENTGSVASEVRRANLVLLYIPTAYGTIVPAAPAVLPDDPALMGGDGDDDPAIASEITRLRLEREVAQLRQQVSEILSRMDSVNK